jgi:ABC-type lipoprotein export system ATPase subunit
MNNSIEIRDASFVYETDIKSRKEVGERRVLHIGNLDVKKGEITFIIGRSGSGKSTLLETIGLMNNTFPNKIPHEMLIDFYFDDKRKDIIRPNIWSKDKEIQAKLNEIRLDYFSFIFQNTNLLSNFTAIDNVCVTDMLNGRSYSEAYFKSLITFSLLGLGDLDINIYPQNISGGQRQRVAFARAIVPDYQFLFGDEPTGNLDRETSIEVLQLLSDFIRGTNSQSSTIIVSHDIELALRFADRIIIITKDDIGEIKPENIFFRDKTSKSSGANGSTYMFKDLIHKAFKKNPALDERFEQLVGNAKSMLEKEPEIKERGYIKFDELLTRIIFLMKNSDNRDKELKKLSFFDDELYNELDNLLKPKSVFAENITDNEQDADVTKGWKRIVNQQEEILGEKELRIVISRLLKFLKSSNRAVETESEGGKSSAQAKESIFFKNFKYLCKIFGVIFKLSSKHLSNPKADINNPDFARLFIKNEGGILLGSGKNLANFRTLFFALFVTFLGIGFATGSLNYLRDKMDDPYVNFVTTSVPSEKQSEVAAIIDHYNNDSLLLKTYNINVFTAFTIFPLEIYSKKSDDLSLITGRTITLNDLLLKELFRDEKNVIAGNSKGFFNEYDCGFIISENLLQKLGLTPEDRFIKVKILTTNVASAEIQENAGISFEEPKDNYELVPIPIRAVLKSIPGDLNQDIDFLITEYFHLNLLNNHEPSKEYPFHPIHTGSLILYYNTPDSSQAEILKDTIKGILKNHPEIVQGFRTRHLRLIKFEEYKENVPFIVQSQTPAGYETMEETASMNMDSIVKSSQIAYTNPGFQVEIGFLTANRPDYHQIRTMYETIYKMLGSMNFDTTKVEQVFIPNKRPVELINTNPRLDRMIIHFKKLDKVEEFSSFLETTKYKYLRMDMAKIMSMKNYNYVANLTTGIIIFLIALSVYFISYFVANVIANHLDRIRMNIGTLMAFGTSGLKYIYMNLISSYMILSILSAFVAVLFAGSIYFCRLILWLIYFFRKGFMTDFSLEPGRYFDIFNWWTLTAVILIFLLSSILSWIKIKEVLQETPGNLIFGRES